MTETSNTHHERTCCLCGRSGAPAAFAQWERMVELQQGQIDLLTEITGRRHGR